MFSSNGSQVSASNAFIEDVFSTYTYAGQNSNQQIINNINTQYPANALIWIKERTGTSSADGRHILGTTSFGTNLQLCSNSTDGITPGQDGGINAFNTDGFTVKYAWNANESGSTYASWTFKATPKFFDIVAYTGTGSARTIAHSLGIAPGMIIVKATSTSGSWHTYHRSLGASYKINLNDTNSASASNGWNNTSPTASVFTLGGDGYAVNDIGVTYVAYLFAHNAGGFGLTGADNAISCGTVTGNGTTPNTFVYLGYEPQWILLKDYVDGGSWYIIDNMRGFPVTGGSHPVLLPNDSSAEIAGFDRAHPQATGFNLGNNDANTYIYVAIRRGPMRVPTVGTSVYNAIARTGTGATTSTSGVGFPPDLALLTSKDGGSYGYVAPFFDRLRGDTKFLISSSTASENTYSSIPFGMNGVTFPAGSEVNGSGNTYIDWYFKRAPGFFDIVCYTGDNVSTSYHDSTPRAITHNLKVVPEIVIIKCRSNASTDWPVNFYPTVPTPGAYPYTNHVKLNADSAHTDSSMFGQQDTHPNTTSTFTVGWNDSTNRTSRTYVAYLFATCPGVSKVGYYVGVGAGTAVTVDCGFAAGPRFVLVKGASGGGSWYVWDSTRGITGGNDPYLFLNSSAAEVTNTDYINTTSTGFQITSSAPGSGQALNALAVRYLFIAIA